jgi:hypothetical protein
MPVLVAFDKGVAMGEPLHDVSQLRSVSSIAFLVLLLAWESLAPFASYFVGRTGERVRHGTKNLVVGILKHYLSALFLWRFGGRLRNGHAPTGLGS